MGVCTSLLLYGCLVIAHEVSERASQRTYLLPGCCFNTTTNNTNMIMKVCVCVTCERCVCAYVMASEGVGGEERSYQTRQCSCLKKKHKHMYPYLTCANNSPFHHPPLSVPLLEESLSVLLL